MAAKMTKCLCSTFEFGTTIDTENGPDFDGYGTGCRQSTTKRFAQGHDAKLVGFLVRAELAGEEIVIVDGGMRMSWGKAVAAALWVSEPLALKAQAMLDAAKARVAKAAAKEAAKVARKSAKAVAPEAQPEPEPVAREVQAKVGRWTYTGVIGPKTGDFVYKSKLGGMKAVPEGKYQIV